MTGGGAARDDERATHAMQALAGWVAAYYAGRPGRLRRPQEPLSRVIEEAGVFQRVGRRRVVLEGLR